MSDDTPNGPSLGALLVELGARRNATIGLVLGVGLAVLAYVYRVIVVDPAPGVESSPVLFGVLAVTLAVSFGAFVAVVLTIGSAIRRARRLD
ncbi:DUF7536 family protein [Halalkalicoccus salilacus]|uniref:DUF7536 family protein n=1 Tax=Halalkalicoccus TaxID=332246 RepID=UPI002F96E67D